MYGLFGENPGRCYAFTGSQLRYYRNPDTLPSYVDQVYDIRMRSTRSQRDMHELQLDMVYDYFVAGGAPVEGRQNLRRWRASLRASGNVSRTARRSLPVTSRRTFITPCSSTATSSIASGAGSIFWPQTTGRAGRT